MPNLCNVICIALLTVLINDHQCHLINSYPSPVNWASQLWVGKVFYGAIQQHFLLERSISLIGSLNLFGGEKMMAFVNLFPMMPDFFFFFSHDASKKKMFEGSRKKVT